MSYRYSGDQLREIAFPLGGIGAGCVSLDGRGGLRDWEIFNRPAKGRLLELTFPALWYRTEGGEKAMAALGPRVRDWVGEGPGFWNYGHGQLLKQVDGLPHFDGAVFEGRFPFARVFFDKANCPLDVSLRAYAPFIPLDIRSSSFPVADLTYTVTNRSEHPVELCLAWTMMNPIGEGAPNDGTEDQARNTFVRGEHGVGITFGNARFNATSEFGGTAALSTNWPDTVYREAWLDSGWFDPLQDFWTDFRHGRLREDAPNDSHRRRPGTLACRATLAPGESVEIPFVFSWIAPCARKYWGGENDKDAHWKPWVATQWPTAWDAAQEYLSRRDGLTRRGLAFEEAFYGSDVDPDVLERVGSSLSILHSPTLLRLEDGTFWAWEGCSGDAGCCSGTCSHVWNYAVAHAHLFPEMQWNMRAAEYQYSFNCGPEGEKGALNFRVPLPLVQEAPLWHAASDGQLGGIVQLYRDWRFSGDDERLKALWPSAKRALGYAWVMWDRDRDGLVDGDMHNTYDINFQGPNPLTQFFYLAALRAAEEIARHLGETDAAQSYRQLYDAGKTKTESVLWNGEYFVQTSDCLADDAPKYQHGVGCLSDQIFGQQAAKLAGLGDLVDPELIRSALRAMVTYNFKDPLGEHENLQRVYAVADEPGLVLCTWPKGGRPKFPFVYSDEVWTGIEYQVAAHLARESMTDEALAIVKGIRRRHDGRRRNPFNEFECGSHYARALASYGVYLALSGLDHDGRTGQTAQHNPHAGRFFLVTPKAWGVATTDGHGGVSFEAVETIG